MRIANGILSLLMLLFAGVQYNDPDGFFWMFVYGGGAIWAAVACFKTEWFDSGPVVWALWASLAAALAGTVYFWPKSDGWWRIDVWWNTETAREGMGMMVLAVVLVIVLWSVNKRKSALAKA